MDRVGVEEFIEALKAKGRDPGVLPEGVRLAEDVPYSRVSAERELLLDLYDREDPPNAPRPAIVFVHGGGWWAGHKKHFFGQAAYLALQHGVLSVAIEYRLSKEAVFPAAIQDVKCALRWVRANAGGFQVDPERVAVAGGSAGGHLAALAATTGHIPDYDGVGGHDGFSSHANLAIVLNGVFDFVSLAGRGEGTASGPVLAFLGGSFGEIPDVYRGASAFHRANPDTPPTLLLHGTHDTTVPCEQSKALYEKLKAMGVAVELELYDGVGHAWFNKPPHFWPVLKRIETFLVERFRFRAR